jgi:ketopantoate reductase
MTLVITTKAFQAELALRSIQSHLGMDARIMVLCNGGLAMREELQRAFVADNQH